MCIRQSYVFTWIHIFLCFLQDRNGYMDENELDALLKDLCEKNKKVRLSSTSCLKDFVLANYIDSHFCQCWDGLVPTQFLEADSWKHANISQNPISCFVRALHTDVWLQQYLNLAYFNP